MVFSPPAARPEPATTLQRVDLNPPHWHQGRRWLVVEGVAGVILGGSGLVGVVVDSEGGGVRVAGVPLTAWLSAVLVGIGAVALAAASQRRFAVLFCAAMTACALSLMLVCAAAAAHHESGPLGFTTPAILLWAVLFCYNLGLGMWLIPDQIGGPTWVSRRRASHSVDRRAYPASGFPDQRVQPAGPSQTQASHRTSERPTPGRCARRWLAEHAPVLALTAGAVAVVTAGAARVMAQRR